MCLHYSTLGKCDDLKAEVAAAVAGRVFVDNQPDVRTAAAFDARLEGSWPKMSSVSTETAGAVAKALEAYQALAVALNKPLPPLMQPALADMRQQVSMLVYKGFVAATPPAWLPHLPRFLAGVQSRLNKLANAGLAKDNAAAAQVLAPWQAYLAKAAENRKRGTTDPELETYRWMLEEFRVSLFAQELKTSLPISAKRLETQWAKVKH